MRYKMMLALALAFVLLAAPLALARHNPFINATDGTNQTNRDVDDDPFVENVVRNPILEDTEATRVQRDNRTDEEAIDISGLDEPDEEFIEFVDDETGFFDEQRVPDNRQGAFAIDYDGDGVPTIVVVMVNEAAIRAATANEVEQVLETVQDGGATTRRTAGDRVNVTDDEEAIEVGDEQIAEERDDIIDPNEDISIDPDETTEPGGFVDDDEA